MSTNGPAPLLMFNPTAVTSPASSPVYRSSTPTASSSHCAMRSPRSVKGVWTTQEHERFLEAMRAFPFGPWKCIADYVGTRSVRQVQSHAQKLREKLSRWSRGLRNGRRRVIRPEHRVDEDVVALWGPLKEIAVPFRAESKVAALATMRSSLSQPLPSGDVPMSPSEYVKQEAVDDRESFDSPAEQAEAEAGEAEVFPSLNESLDFLIARLDRRASAPSAVCV